ncbi:hypothetical protein Q7P37_004026 [Cladosporium fusiforme]
MAQGIRRPPRHGRQASRIARLVGRDEKQQHGQPAKVPDEATVSYVKRTLCKQHNTSVVPGDSSEETDHKSLDELLPPLTSSNEVDLQLYALIAVVLNLFVQTWYNKITPDQDFVANVVQIIAHCTRGLEQRLRHVDLESLVFDELPAILVEHIDAVRIAAQSTHSPGPNAANRIVYHTLRPHHALTPVPTSPESLADQQENESVWCQMVVNRALALLLPHEEHQNPCLQVLVSEILSEMIFHNGICGKACESWLIWEGVTKIIYTIRPEVAPRPQHTESQNPDRLAQFGLLSKDGAASNQSNQRPQHSRIDALTHSFWALLQSMWLIWLLLRSSITTIVQASSLPSRSINSQGAKSEMETKADIIDDGNGLDPEFTSQKPPILGMAIWTSLSRLTRLPDRMPWLTGMLSLMQWLSLFGPGQVCYTDSRLDRLLSHTIHTRVLSPALLPPALQAIRSAIFPDNALGQARVPPSEDEAIAIRRECARAIIQIVPPYVRTKFFATEDVALAQEDVEDSLGLFADSYLNKHLVVEIVELVVLRLFPEVAEEQ